METNNVTQLGLSTLSGLNQSKISRLLQDETRCDREDLEKILTAFPSAADRYEIALGHHQDEIPGGTLSGMEIRRSEPNEPFQDAPMDLRKLTARGESALRFLLGLVPEVPSIEDIFADLARALGWDEKQVAARNAPPPPKPGTIRYKQPGKNSNS